MINPNPKCEKECRFKYGASFSTAVWWERIYDKNGNLITSDPNSTRGSVECLICHKSWDYIGVAGTMTYEEKNK